MTQPNTENPEDKRSKAKNASTSAKKRPSTSSAKKTARKSSAKKTSKATAQRGTEPKTWRNRITGITNSAVNIARKTTGGSIKVGKSILNNQEQLKVMVAAGESLRDLREVAGLTISELSDAINLKDRSLLEAVENGTSTLSFELILRLAALLARNDPIPFIIKYTRTYNPDVWRILDDWGLGRIPLQYERERKFINIYRRHDAARALSDEGYDKVLAFTSNAFEMALHFIADAEDIKPNNNDKTEEKLNLPTTQGLKNSPEIKEAWRKKKNNPDSDKDK